MRHLRPSSLIFVAVVVLASGCSDETPGAVVETGDTDHIEDAETPGDAPIAVDDTPANDDGALDSSRPDSPTADADAAIADSPLDANSQDVPEDALHDVSPDNDAADTAVFEDLTEGDTVDAEADAATDPGDVADDSGLFDEALIAALHQQTLTGHHPLGYTPARDAMYAVGGIDDHDGRIEGIYTGRTVVTNGSRTPGNDCRLADGTATSCAMNTEHTWAKYEIRQTHPEGTAEYDAAEGDIHHIFPADQDVNSARWHFPFGPTACGTTASCRVDEESELGLAPGSTGSPSCPTGNLELDQDCNMLVRPARRGDVARAQFYMAVRYSMPISDASEAALRLWNDEDPPDARERTRNDAIEAAQGNRNPFVDHPELVSRIANF